MMYLKIRTGLVAAFVLAMLMPLAGCGGERREQVRPHQVRYPKGHDDRRDKERRDERRYEEQRNNHRYEEQRNDRRDDERRDDRRRDEKRDSERHDDHDSRSSRA